MRDKPRGEDPYAKPRDYSEPRAHGPTPSTNPREGREGVSYRRVGDAAGPREPTQDKDGRDVFDGERNTLRWYPNVQVAMEPLRGGGCQLKRPKICTGKAQQIDHKATVAAELSKVPTRIICDGVNHWKGQWKSEALAIYNGGIDPNDPNPPVAARFQWSCKKCNPSKNGLKGVDKGVPKIIGACPGGDHCGNGAKVDDA